MVEVLGCFYHLKRYNLISLCGNFDVSVIAMCFFCLFQGSVYFSYLVDSEENVLFPNWMTLASRPKTLKTEQELLFTLKVFLHLEDSKMFEEGVKIV